MKDFAWLGLNIGSSLGWAPTPREGWLIVIICLVMTLLASLVVGRVMRFFIAIGVIVALVSIGALAAFPG